MIAEKSPYQTIVAKFLSMDAALSNFLEAQTMLAHPLILGSLVRQSPVILYSAGASSGMPLRHLPSSVHHESR